MMTPFCLAPGYLSTRSMLWEIITGLQTRFGVMLPEGNVAAMRTINTLADLVETELATAVVA